MPIISKKIKSKYAGIEILGKAGELIVEDTPQDIVQNISNVVAPTENITSQSSTAQDTVQGDDKSETTDNSNERKDDNY